MMTSSSPEGVSVEGRAALLLLRLLCLFQRMGSSLLGGATWEGPGPASPHRALNSGFLNLLLDL